MSWIYKINFFKACIIECTAEDQKKVRKQLNTVFTMIERAEKTVTPL